MVPPLVPGGPPSGIPRRLNLTTAQKTALVAFLRTLNEVPGKFVRTLAAVRDQKEKQAA